MRSEPDNIESRLLDYHLDQMDDEAKAQFEQELNESPELAARSDRLRQLLGPLDHDAVPAPPADLATGVMAHIESQERILPFDESASAIPSGSSHEFSGRPVLSLRELISIAAIITLFVGIFVPGYRKAQNIKARNLCRNNLSQIWQGMSTYAGENDGQLAWAGHIPNASWLPTRTPQVPRYSNTKPAFLLLREGYIPGNDPRVFICPSTPHGRPMLTDNLRDFDDFAEEANVSYSFQLMNTPKPRRAEQMHSSMVIIADANPLFDRQDGKHRISPYDEINNSFTHEDGAGQNAVYITGQGGWFNTPRIGVDRDNIYRMGTQARYTGTESISSATESFVVP